MDIAPAASPATPAIRIAPGQIPPRNVNWAAKGRWVHTAKVAFAKYFLHKVRSGNPQPFYETLIMRAIGLEKVKSNDSAR
jgi:sulfide:quinone oxidoreductase